MHKCTEYNNKYSKYFIFVNHSVNISFTICSLFVYFFYFLNIQVTREEIKISILKSCFEDANYYYFLIMQGIFTRLSWQKTFSYSILKRTDSDVFESNLFYLLYILSTILCALLHFFRCLQKIIWYFQLFVQISAAYYYLGIIIANVFRLVFS